jgi:hypothetical protein
MKEQWTGTATANLFLAIAGAADCLRESCWAVVSAGDPQRELPCGLLWVRELEPCYDRRCWKVLRLA